MGLVLFNVPIGKNKFYGVMIMATTIFDNLNDNRYELAKKNLIENGNADPSEDEIYEEVSWMEQNDWEDIKQELDGFFDGKTVIARGRIGRWNGSYDGWSYGDFNKVRCDLLRDCDYMTFEDSRGHFGITGIHHDGRNYCEVRILTEAGIRAIEDWEYDYRFKDLSDSEMIDKLWNSRHYCRIAHFAKDVWGCKEVA